MDFDFASYLKELDPEFLYDLEKLTGGVVNVAIRATKSGVA